MRRAATLTVVALGSLVAAVSSRAVAQARPAPRDGAAQMERDPAIRRIADRASATDRDTTRFERFTTRLRDVGLGNGTFGAMGGDDALTAYFAGDTLRLVTARVTGGSGGVERRFYFDGDQFTLAGERGTGSNRGAGGCAFFSGGRPLYIAEGLGGGEVRVLAGADARLMADDYLGQGYAYAAAARRLRVSGQARAVAQAERDATAARGVLVSMRDNLRTLVTNQEAHFSDHTTYTLDLGRARYRSTNGVAVVMLKATGTGWSARATHPRLPGKSCVIWVGSVSPLPTTDGSGRRAAAEGEPTCDEP